MHKILAALVAVLAIGAPAAAQTKKYAVTPTLAAIVEHDPGTATVRVLMPGVEAIELGLTQPASSTFLIKTADYNFDGYKDFAFTSRGAEPGAPVAYDVFLYHPENKTFEALEVDGTGVCEGLSNLRLSAADKTLRTSCRGATRTSTDVYRWETPYSLALVKSTDNSAETTAERDAEKQDAKTEKDEARKEARDARREAREESREEEEE